MEGEEKADVLFCVQDLKVEVLPWSLDSKTEQDMA